MIRRKALLIMGIVGVVLALVPVRNYFSDPSRIARLLKKVTRAVETAAPLALTESIDADYNDAYGLDKPSLILAVQTYRRQFAALKISIQNLHITVQNDRADARFLAKATATTRGEGSETSVFADRFHLTFRKTSDGWKLLHVEGPDVKFD